MTIKELTIDEIRDALPLVWDVFCKYEAVNYPIDGKEAFYQAIHSEEYLRMLTAYGAFDEERLVGIIATRCEGTHIALFFVDGEYHRRGIGRSLFEYCVKSNTSKQITVHSSEYAVEVYSKLGFVQTMERREEGGIHFVPMKFER